MTQVEASNLFVFQIRKPPFSGGFLIWHSNLLGGLPPRRLISAFLRSISHDRPVPSSLHECRIFLRTAYRALPSASAQFHPFLMRKISRKPAASSSPSPQMSLRCLPGQMRLSGRVSCSSFYYALQETGLSVSTRLPYIGFCYNPSP